MELLRRLVGQRKKHTLGKEDPQCPSAKTTSLRPRKGVKSQIQRDWHQAEAQSPDLSSAPVSHQVQCAWGH